jgi:hypothetical protein
VEGLEPVDTTSLASVTPPDRGRGVYQQGQGRPPWMLAPGGFGPAAPANGQPRRRRTSSRIILRKASRRAGRSLSGIMKRVEDIEVFEDRVTAVIVGRPQRRTASGRKNARRGSARPRNGRSYSARGRSARPVAVDGVRDENSDTDDAEERGNCIQHGNDP